jgi:transketolase
MLFAKHLRHSPSNPDWPERDRFVLSAGHASMLLYSLLHLTGYDLSLDDLRSFRRLGSRTPGHPERGDTPGVEITTGPLGQGFANSVGFAMAEAMLAARYNRPGHAVIDHRTWFICSDGDLMEGISHEAASLAGFLGLERLIGIYDANEVSLDGPTELSFAENVPERFAAYGWRVLEVRDANDLEAIDRALTAAAVPDGRPTLIVYSSHIGYGSPNKQDSAQAHGSPLGEDEVAATKRNYGWPEDAFFEVPDDVEAWREELVERGKGHEAEYAERLASYTEAFPAEAAELARVGRGDLPEGWEDAIPRHQPGKGMATRKSSGAALNALAEVVPEIVQGAADLSTSTGTDLKGLGRVGRGDFAGRNIYYGVREHAMGAITNGIAAHAGLRPVCSTFFTFSDYMKNTIRLAALMHLPSIFVYTHDSVGLGEDGPTHQPIEHLAALRAIPDLVTIRPADANEAAEAWRVAIGRRDRPTAMVLSRQDLPTLDGPADVARGAYVLADGDDCILIGTGSEVTVALAARDLLAAEGIGARVVSMPSFELFSAQPAEYREAVLPGAVRARVAVEAAATFGWERWVGLDGAIIGIDRFGISAPGDEVMRALGITPEAVADAARGLLA